MKKLLLFALISFLGLFLLMIFVFSTEKEILSGSNYRAIFKSDYKILTPPFPDSVVFAGEKAPLSLFYVREKLDEQLMRNTYFHSSTIGLIKRSHRWFPVIDKILKENNIPEDFEFLVMIESGLMNVVSPKGATGFWQFMEKTAREYGLEVNKSIDERYNVEKSTAAACRYLKDSYEEFNDWTLVAAAYNAGQRRIKDAIEKQKTGNYYDLYLNDETSRYLYRIMAIKTIYNSPTKYGFYIRKSDLYPVIPTKEITVSNTIPNLVDFAEKQGISYKILKIFNPWLRSDKLPDESHKTYHIKIPEKKYLNPENVRTIFGNEDEIFNDTLRVEDL